MDASLITHLLILPDPRIDRTKRYPLIEIIFLVVAATISGCEGWKQIKDFGDVKLLWLRKFLPYKDGIPVDDTIARVMRRLNTKIFQETFSKWMQAISLQTEGDIIAIDGKTLRRSHDKRNDKAAIHMVSAWSSANGVVLGQEKTAEKSNEITAIPELLNTLALKGCIVSIDAMGCQTVIASKIIQSEADYILALKKNQGLSYDDVATFFDEAFSTNFQNILHDYYEESNKGHGRQEHRQCWTIDVALYDFPNLSKWKNLKTISATVNTRQIGDKIEQDTKFYISSLAPCAKKILTAARKHWGIENSLHWVLDMTFREDESRIRAESSPENLAIIRHIALNIVKLDTSLKASVKRKLLRSSLDDEYRYTVMKQAIMRN